MLTIDILLHQKTVFDDEVISNSLFQYNMYNCIKGWYSKFYDF